MMETGREIGSTDLDTLLIYMECVKNHSPEKKNLKYRDFKSTSL